MAKCKYSLGVLLAAAFMLLAPLHAHAACSNPAAAAGTMIYNEDENVPQYCDDTNWIAMAPLGGVDIQGITCDGSSSYLSRATPWDGVENATKMSGSYWFRRNTDNGVNNVVMQGEAGKWHTQIINNDRLQIRAENAEFDTVINMFSNSLYTDTEWHHFLWSVDLETPGSARFYVDGVDDEFVGLTEFGDQNAGNGINDVMDLDLIDWGFCVNTAFGGAYWDGDIAEFWIDFGTYIDFSVEENRRKFIQANGRPAYLGKSGQLPTGMQPDIYLSGGAAEFPNNKGTGGDLAVGSAITDAAAEPDGIGEGRGLSVVDSINNDTTNFETVEDIALYGDYLVAASAGDDKISVVDISDPENISYVASVAAITSPQNVEIHGNYVYTIEFAFDADFYVIDVSDPTNPFVTDFLPTPHDECIGLKQVDGNTVFASCWAGSDNVVSFDVSDPYNISQLDVWTDGGCDDPTQIARQENTLFIGCVPNVIYSIDATNPSDLQTLDSLVHASLDSPRDMAVKGDYLYISSRGNHTLVVVNISDPSNMTYVTSIQDVTNHGEPEGIFVHGNYLYVPGQTTASLAIYDVSNPAAPALVDTLIDGTNLVAAESVVVRGHYAYVGKSTQSGPGNGVAVIDLGTRSECSDPPGAIGTLNYNLDEHAPIYCDGDHWVAMSEDTLDRGLVGHWKLDETSGTSVTDYAGSNTGTFADEASITPASGVDGGGIVFDGVNDRVDVGNDASTALQYPMTISAWVNIDQLPSTKGAHMAIMARDVSGTDRQFEWRIQSTDHLILTVYPDGDGGAQIAAGSSAGNEFVAGDVGRWVHVAVTVDENGNQRTYKDGIDVGGGTYGDLTIYPAATTTTIGNANNSGNTIYEFDGAIDDVRMYSRSLSASEIAALYQRGLDDDGLVAYWPMNELGGVTARDYAGMYDGNLVNGPVFSSAGGQIGGALEFDGTDDYIDADDVLNYTGQQSFTLSTWVNFGDDPLTNTHFLMEKGNSYWLWWNGTNEFALGDNTLVFGYRHSGGDAEIVEGWAPSQSQWYHIAGVHDASADTLTLYVNGSQLAAPTTGMTQDLLGSTGSLLLGSATPPVSYQMNGFMDDARIYDRALSDIEINAIYQAGFVGLAEVECSSPYGKEGSMIYDVNVTAVVYCDGVNWVKLGKR